MTERTWTEWGLDELRREFLNEDHFHRLADFVAEGKTVLVYENIDLGHPEIGHTIAVTWYEPELPDVSKSCPYTLEQLGLMSWRYYPKAVVRP